MSNKCPFCIPPENDDFLYQGDYWYMRWDKYPVNNGHILLTTKRHIQRTDQLIMAEWNELSAMLIMALSAIQQKYGQFNGYNFGTNNGAASGQTIDHVHFHVIPRWTGDCENPRGGIRKIKSALVEY